VFSRKEVKSWESETFPEPKYKPKKKAKGLRKHIRKQKAEAREKRTARLLGIK